MATFNKRKIRNIITKAFAETCQEYFTECQDVIADNNAFIDFPNQDIIDTGNLRNSGSLTKVDDAHYVIDYDTNYALYVHEGYTLRNGGKQKGRPWTKVAEEKLNLEETLAKKIADKLK